MRTSIKTEITLNGGGFDTPSDIKIERSEDIPSCKLTFPRRIGSRYRATKKDVIRVYVGMDGIPAHPVFTGYMESEEGFHQTQMQLYGIQSRAMKEYAVINDTHNYDGSEVSTSILDVLKSITSLNRPGIIQSKFLIEQTNPAVKVPLDTRMERGTSKYELIKQFVEMSKDNSNMKVRNYVLFEFGDDIYFRKEPDTESLYPHITVAYGKSLIEFNETNKGTESINAIRVIGKDVQSFYKNDHREGVDGYREGEPVSDNNISSVGKCQDVARSLVQSRLFDNFGIELESPSLLHAIPGATLVQITDAPYGLNGKYIVRSIGIDVSSSSFRVSGSVDNPISNIGDALSEVLGLNRNIYPGASQFPS